MANPSFSPDAAADLAEIWCWGAETFEESQADTYYFGLFETADTIAAMPGIGFQPLDDAPHIRVHPTGAHVIVYRVSGQREVDVLRILSMRQDWLAALKRLE